MVNIILSIVYHKKQNKTRNSDFEQGKGNYIKTQESRTIERILLWSIYSDQTPSRSVERLILGLLRLLFLKGRNKETVP